MEGDVLGAWGNAPGAGGTKVWGKIPHHTKNFALFCKNNFIVGIFWQKLMLLKHGIEIGKANMIKLVA